ncbi:MAG TPA: hypothetical protein VHT05_11815 [Candidatus Elarobacter sp.]|jgi:hypothetical protein|nr:hypothetical protein [Candidatus Elarobacter sp.]
MIRWIDGFYGGLAAGVTSASFYALAAAAWVRDDGPAGFFAQIAQTVPGLRGAPVAWPEIGLGLAIYIAVAGALGIVYALAAVSFRSMLRAPTSLLWGLGYGLLVWWLISDVAVPVLGAADMRPLWEGLVATVLFYGVVLSEVTTMARRAAERP